MTERITSRQNPLAVQIRKLNGSRSLRRETGLFVGEGPKLLEEALKAGWDVPTVVTAGECPLPLDPAVRHIEVPRELLVNLCDTKTRLRRPLRPQNGAGHHGGLLPAARL